MKEQILEREKTITKIEEREKDYWNEMKNERKHKHWERKKTIIKKEIMKKNNCKSKKIFWKRKQKLKK